MSSGTNVPKPPATVTSPSSPRGRGSPKYSNTTLRTLLSSQKSIKDGTANDNDLTQPQQQQLQKLVGADSATRRPSSKQQSANNASVASVNPYSATPRGSSAITEVPLWSSNNSPYGKKNKVPSTTSRDRNGGPATKKRNAGTPRASETYDQLSESDDAYMNDKEEADEAEGEDTMEHDGGGEQQPNERVQTTLKDDTINVGSETTNPAVTPQAANGSTVKAVDSVTSPLRPAPPVVRRLRPSVPYHLTPSSPLTSPKVRGTSRPADSRVTELFIRLGATSVKLDDKTARDLAQPPVTSFGHGDEININTASPREQQESPPVSPLSAAKQQQTNSSHRLLLLITDLVANAPVVMGTQADRLEEAIEDVLEAKEDAKLSATADASNSASPHEAALPPPPPAGYLDVNLFDNLLRRLDDLREEAIHRRAKTLKESYDRNRDAAAKSGQRRSLENSRSATGEGKAATTFRQPHYNPEEEQHNNLDGRRSPYALTEKLRTNSPSKRQQRSNRQKGERTEREVASGDDGVESAADTHQSRESGGGSHASPVGEMGKLFKRMKQKVAEEKKMLAGAKKHQQDLQMRNRHKEASSAYESAYRVARPGSPRSGGEGSEAEDEFAPSGSLEQVIENTYFGRSLGGNSDGGTRGRHQKSHSNKPSSRSRSPISNLIPQLRTQNDKSSFQQQNYNSSTTRPSSPMGATNTSENPTSPSLPQGGGRATPMMNDVAFVALKGLDKIMKNKHNNDATTANRPPSLRPSTGNANIRSGVRKSSPTATQTMSSSSNITRTEGAYDQSASVIFNSSAPATTGATDPRTNSSARGLGGVPYPSRPSFQATYTGHKVPTAPYSPPPQSRSARLAATYGGAATSPTSKNSTPASPITTKKVAVNNYVGGVQSKKEKDRNKDKDPTKLRMRKESRRIYQLINADVYEVISSEVEVPVTCPNEQFNEQLELMAAPNRPSSILSRGGTFPFKLQRLLLFSPGHGNVLLAAATVIKAFMRARQSESIVAVLCRIEKDNDVAKLQQQQQQGALIIDTSSKALSGNATTKSPRGTSGTKPWLAPSPPPPSLKIAMQLSAEALMEQAMVDHRRSMARRRTTKQLSVSEAGVDGVPVASGGGYMLPPSPATGGSSAAEATPEQQHHHGDKPQNRRRSRSPTDRLKKSGVPSTQLYHYFQWRGYSAPSQSLEQQSHSPNKMSPVERRKQEQLRKEAAAVTVYAFLTKAAAAWKRWKKQQQVTKALNLQEKISRVRDLQAFARGKLGLIATHRKIEDLFRWAAAIVIQKYVKAHILAKNRLHRQQRKIETEVKRRITAEQKDRKVALVQALQRRRLAQKNSKKRQARVQTSMRKEADRLHLEHLKDVLKRFAALAWCKKHLEIRKRRAATEIYNRIHEEAHILQAQDAAATKIQSLGRSIIAKKVLGQRKEKQSAAEAARVATEVQEIANATIIFQKYCRSGNAKRLVGVKKVKVNDFRNKECLEEENAIEQERVEATIVFQKFCRSGNAKREVARATQKIAVRREMEIANDDDEYQHSDKTFSKGDKDDLLSREQSKPGAPVVLQVDEEVAVVEGNHRSIKGADAEKDSAHVESTSVKAHNNTFESGTAGGNNTSIQESQQKEVSGETSVAISEAPLSIFIKTVVDDIVESVIIVGKSGDEIKLVEAASSKDKTTESQSEQPPVDKPAAAVGDSTTHEAKASLSVEVQPVLAMAEATKDAAVSKPNHYLTLPGPATATESVDVSKSEHEATEQAQPEANSDDTNLRTPSEETINATIVFQKYCRSGIAKRQSKRKVQDVSQNRNDDIEAEENSGEGETDPTTLPTSSTSHEAIEEHIKTAITEAVTKTDVPSTPALDDQHQKIAAAIVFQKYCRAGNAKRKVSKLTTRLEECRKVRTLAEQEDGEDDVTPVAIDNTNEGAEAPKSQLSTNSENDKPTDAVDAVHSEDPADVEADNIQQGKEKAVIVFQKYCRAGNARRLAQTKSVSIQRLRDIESATEVRTDNVEISRTSTDATAADVRISPNTVDDGRKLAATKVFQKYCRAGNSKRAAARKSQLLSQLRDEEAAKELDGDEAPTPQPNESLPEGVEIKLSDTDRSSLADAARLGATITCQKHCRAGNAKREVSRRQERVYQTLQADDDDDEGDAGSHIQATQQGAHETGVAQSSTVCETSANTQRTDAAIIFQKYCRSGNAKRIATRKAKLLSDRRNWEIEVEAQRAEEMPTSIPVLGTQNGTSSQVPNSEATVTAQSATEVKDAPAAETPTLKIKSPVYAELVKGVIDSTIEKATTAKAPKTNTAAETNDAPKVQASVTDYLQLSTRTQKSQRPRDTTHALEELPEEELIIKQSVTRNEDLSSVAEDSVVPRIEASVIDYLQKESRSRKADLHSGPAELEELPSTPLDDESKPSSPIDYLQKDFKSNKKRGIAAPRFSTSPYELSVELEPLAATARPQDEGDIPKVEASVTDYLQKDSKNRKMPKNIATAVELEPMEESEEGAAAVDGGLQTEASTIDYLQKDIKGKKTKRPVAATPQELELSEQIAAPPFAADGEAEAELFGPDILITQPSIMPSRRATQTEVGK